MRHFKLRIRIIIFAGLDLLSKYVFYNMQYLEHTSLIRPALNTGISRSLPVPFIVIVVVSILAIGVFIILYIKHKIGRLITALLIAGTLGNLIDRIIYGAVRDFINIGLFNFPIFNIADMMLTIGAGIRILAVMLEKKN